MRGAIGVVFETFGECDEVRFWRTEEGVVAGGREGGRVS